MFLLSYKQVVKFKKAGTATLFLQLAPFIFILPVCMYVIRYALLRVFSCDTASHITVISWISLLPVCYIVGVLLTFHSQNTPKDLKRGESGSWEGVVYVYSPIYCISILFQSQIAKINLAVGLDFALLAGGGDPISRYFFIYL